MGTRSQTDFVEGNSVILRIYRQYDGYPKCHGKELAAACDYEIVNGLCGDDSKVANGMGELAAKALTALKTANPHGNIYVDDPNSADNDWCEFFYTVRVVGNRVVIDCQTDEERIPPKKESIND